MLLLQLHLVRNSTSFTATGGTPEEAHQSRSVANCGNLLEGGLER